MQMSLKLSTLFLAPRSCVGLSGARSMIGTNRFATTAVSLLTFATVALSWMMVRSSGCILHVGWVHLGRADYGYSTSHSSEDPELYLEQMSSDEDEPRDRPRPYLGPSYESSFVPCLDSLLDV